VKAAYESSETLTNGVTLRLLASGNYTWAITVEADSGSVDDLNAAADRAREVSRRLEDELPHVAANG
jgi:hypothetical protein